MVKFQKPVEDVSILQIGTEGSEYGKKFTVTGRIQFLLEEGLINIWCLKYSDGKYGLLADYEGGYAVVTFEFIKSDLKLSGAHPGNILSAFKQEYEIRRISQVKYFFAEGELQQDLGFSLSKEKVVELGNTSNGVTLAFISSPFQAKFFYGTFIPFEDLNFQNLRPHYEWVQ